MQSQTLFAIAPRRPNCLLAISPASACASTAAAQTLAVSMTFEGRVCAISPAIVPAKISPVPAVASVSVPPIGFKTLVEVITCVFSPFATTTTLSASAALSLPWTRKAISDGSSLL